MIFARLGFRRRPASLPVLSVIVFGAGFCSRRAGADGAAGIPVAALNGTTWA